MTPVWYISRRSCFRSCELLYDHKESTTELLLKERENKNPHMIILFFFSVVLEKSRIMEVQYV